MTRNRNFEERAKRLTVTSNVSDNAQVTTAKTDWGLGFKERQRSVSEEGLDFENDGQNQRTLGGLLVDVALEVHTNFFFDHGPVGAFFRVRSVDGFQNDVAGACDQVVAIVAHEAARDDFRLGFEFAAVLVDSDDRDYH